LAILQKVDELSQGIYLIKFSINILIALPSPPIVDCIPVKRSITYRERNIPF
jgi:hypothetical protein